jgi:uncharacterized protein
MLYAVLFEDDATRTDARTRLMQDHLAFLDRNAASISAAGPLRDPAANDAATGGLWLVEASDVTRVMALVESDPFWPTGLRKNVRVLRWAQVFAAGKRVVLTK